MYRPKHSPAFLIYCTCLKKMEGTNAWRAVKNNKDEDNDPKSFFKNTSFQMSENKCSIKILNFVKVSLIIQKAFIIFQASIDFLEISLL